MRKSIIDYLKEVSDPQEAKGSRGDLWQILLINLSVIKVLAQ